MNQIFFNEFGRLRSGWRFAIFFLSFSIASTFLGLLVIMAANQFAVDLRSFFAGSIGLGIQAGVSLVAALFFGILYGKLFEGLPARALGLIFHPGWAKHLFWGLMAGMAAILIAALIPQFFGGISFRLNTNASFEVILQTLIVSGVVFLIGAIGEEILFRGYMLQTFSRAGLPWLGVLLTSLPFAAAHLDNPNVSPYFTFINTSLAGIWLGIAYLKTRSMWFPFAIHFIWNWFQGAILGLNVSGIRQITPDPVLLATDMGPSWFTGGHYGIEGGISCAIALIISTVFIYFAPLVKADPELLALSDREIPKTLPQMPKPS